jgi:hypothetical protein
MESYSTLLRNHAMRLVGTLDDQEKVAGTLITTMDGFIVTKVKPKSPQTSIENSI